MTIPLLQLHAPDLHAPELFTAESMSALRALERRAEISSSRADDAANDLRALPLRRYPTEILAPRIWNLRGRFTVYDAHYVALAEAMSAPLVTGDRRLATAAADFIDILIV